MNLIQEYLMLVNEAIPYGEIVPDGVYVAKRNRKVDRMIAIAAEIENNHPELKNEFYQLLFSENKEIRLWVAHHVLERMNYENSYRKNALKRIRHRAKWDTTIYGLGERLWLKDWYKTHPEDRWLR